LLLLIAGCSREQQDWRTAEASDTIESYGRFIEHHPESELIRQARTRITQLGEDRDWQRTGSADTADAYREFIAQHPSGKWTQEARIRMESFSLGGHAGTAAVGLSAVSPATASGAPVAAGAPAVSLAATVPAASDGPVHAASGAPVSAVGDGPVSAVGNDPVSVPVSSTAPASGEFGIQLGAFTSEAGADGQWRALAARFGSELQGLQQHIVAADTASGRVYRLQAAVGSEARARAICDSLHKQAQACVAVLPH